MPLSPASSKHEPSDQQRREELQRQCATNGNQGDSDSSREDGVYDTIHAATADTANPPAGPMEEPQGNGVVIRIGIPDLQQTPVFQSRCFGGVLRRSDTAGYRRGADCPDLSGALDERCVSDVSCKAQSCNHTTDRNLSKGGCLL
ncbi:hypothetical protein AAFF_G00265670 [Aldrovandia affinis]|uniref:Uncharacterized protein n=1 Tax=Aldrovandia affinis TaxID=143900 RepID=A0AAD7RBI6_9TELE|nr:hypothetical protein AAFF_G00265670 [Aldrovandia affinis]